MKLEEVVLKNFRNYSKRKFNFAQNTTIFVGPNAVGKTNLLEAIFLLALGKSFRADREGEMVKIDEEVARVSGKIREIDEPKDLEVVITGGFVYGRKTPIKKYLVNGVSRRVIDFAGNLTAVLFHPEDLDLARGSPSQRRRYLDFVLVQVDREYRRSKESYDKALRQRNRLLEQIRDGMGDRSQLYFWDHLLIKDGNFLTNKREELVEAINLSSKPFGAFKIVYDRSIISETRLQQYAQEEVAVATTLVGPHRDDLQFFEKRRDLTHYGSRGEQRLLVIWMKLAELDFIENNKGERPLLLLDDVFSELDHNHREEVIKITNRQQTIITTTDVHFVPEIMVKEAEMIKLESNK